MQEFGKFLLSDSWEAMKGTYILLIVKEQKISLYVDYNLLSNRKEQR